LDSLAFEKINPSIAWPVKNRDFPISFLNFSLSVSGDYIYLKEFVSRLESYRRIIKIQEASFRQAKVKSDKEDSTKLSVSVSGQVFFEKDSL